jgi:hypothetical protein
LSASRAPSSARIGRFGPRGGDRGPLNAAVAFMSDNTIEPDMALEAFVLESLATVRGLARRRACRYPSASEARGDSLLRRSRGLPELGRTRPDSRESTVRHARGCPEEGAARAPSHLSGLCPELLQLSGARSARSLPPLRRPAQRRRLRRRRRPALEPLCAALGPRHHASAVHGKGVA